MPEGTIFCYEGLDLPYRIRRTNETERVFGASAEEFVRYQKTMGMDASSAYGEPQFIDAESRDYRLKPRSPGANLATDGGPVGARGITPLSVAEISWHE